MTVYWDYIYCYKIEKSAKRTNSYLYPYHQAKNPLDTLPNNHKPIP